MTNEKAIEELSVLYERYSKASENRKHTASTGNYGMIDGQYVEAIDLAIKALEQTSWIPVSERLPEELVPVNITWINHSPESYYTNIKDKPFTATGVYFNGQWYWWSTLCTDMLAEYSHNYDDIIDDDIEITAWMPLPSSYQGEENG